MAYGPSTVFHPSSPLNAGGRHGPAARHVKTRDPIAAEDRILADLRAFARDLGLGGAGSMSKDELVEGLRQRYVLESLLGRAMAPETLPVRGTP